MPLLKAEHLEHGLAGDSATEGVLTDLPDHGAESLVVDAEAEGHAYTAAALTLVLAECSPLWTVVNHIVCHDKPASSADLLTRVVVDDDIL